MTPSAPKLRGRGVRRRGFGPQNISPGTDQEWEQMLDASRWEPRYRPMRYHR